MKRRQAFVARNDDGTELRVWVHIGDTTGDLEVVRGGQVIWQQELMYWEIALFMAAASRPDAGGVMVEHYMVEVNLNIEARKKDFGR